MAKRSTVAIHARISRDRTAEELGAMRQLRDCRVEAERRGWHVAEEYVDDDGSAYSGKARPAYQQMLTDLAEGRRDGVIVWHMAACTAGPSSWKALWRRAGGRACAT